MIIYLTLGGFFGALSRAAMNNYVKVKGYRRMPLATIVVNFLGAFLIGLLLKVSLSGTMYGLLVIGFLGSFTTFSTMIMEMLTMLERKEKAMFSSYFLLSYLGGITCTWLGILSGNFIY